jgi:tRNA(Ile)-lysidine synthase
MTLIEKVSKYAAEHSMLEGVKTLLVGVSGGADSVCLLHCLLELSKSQGFTVKALHFNHKLREPSLTGTRPLHRNCAIN